MEPVKSYTRSALFFLTLVISVMTNKAFPAERTIEPKDCRRLLARLSTIETFTALPRVFTDHLAIDRTHHGVLVDSPPNGVMTRARRPNYLKPNLSSIPDAERESLVQMGLLAVRQEMEDLATLKTQRKLNLSKTHGASDTFLLSIVVASTLRTPEQQVGAARAMWVVNRLDDLADQFYVWRLIGKDIYDAPAIQLIQLFDNTRTHLNKRYYEAFIARAEKVETFNKKAFDDAIRLIVIGASLFSQKTNREKETRVNEFAQYIKDKFSGNPRVLNLLDSLNALYISYIGKVVSGAYDAFSEQTTPALTVVKDLFYAGGGFANADSEILDKQLNRSLYLNSSIMARQLDLVWRSIQTEHNKQEQEFLLAPLRLFLDVFENPLRQNGLYDQYAEYADWYDEQWAEPSPSRKAFK